jgi:hypothetical protein
MTRRNVALAALALSALAGSLEAQQGITVRESVRYEQYSFDTTATNKLVFRNVSELAIPVTVTVPFGRLASFTLSSGYASVALTSAVSRTLLPNQSVSGLLDTQGRLSVNVIPGRLILLATGTIPSGQKTLSRDELFILGPLSSDIIGFTAGNLGSGGSVGGGFAGAIPMGRYALGVGGTFSKPMSFQPVLGTSDELLPGAEFRARLGFEGPLARRTYMRLAGVYAVRQKDQVSGTTLNGVGNRVITYAAVTQGIGARGSIMVYGFDVFRADPQIEQTAVGAALLPRGNLLALGGQFTMGLGRTTTLVPRLEYRAAALAADTADTTLRRAGSTVRIGANMRQQFSRQFAIVVLGSGVVGNVVNAGEDVGFGGFRFGLNLEYNP